MANLKGFRVWQVTSGEIREDTTFRSHNNWIPSSDSSAKVRGWPCSLEVANQQSYHMMACQTSLVVCEKSSSGHLVLAFFRTWIIQKLPNLDCCQKLAEIELYPALLTIHHFHHWTNVLLGKAEMKQSLARAAVQKRAFFVVFVFLFTETVKKMIFTPLEGISSSIVGMQCSQKFCWMSPWFWHLKSFEDLGRLFVGVLGEAFSFPKFISAILNNTETGSRLSK